MNDSTMFVMVFLVMTTTIGLALLITLFWVKKVRNSGGIGAFRQRLQQESKVSTPVYPTVNPTPSPRRAIGCGMGILMLMIAVVAGGAVMQMVEVQNIRRLQNEGVVAVARISDKKINEDSESGDTYYLYYTFSAGADGEEREYTRRESVPEDFYDRTEPGAPIEIVYVPGSPDISRLREFYTPGKVSYWGVVIGAGGFLPGLILGLGQIRDYRNARRLDDESVQTITRVVEHYTDQDSDGNTYYIIYELPGVGLVRQPVTRNLQIHYPVGSSVRLIYLPDNPLIFRLEDENPGFASQEI